MMGFCSVNGVIESNGDVFPCDFYVLDEYKIGSIINDNFEKIFQNRTVIGSKSTFITAKHRS